MIKEAIATGNSIEEAKEAAVMALGADDAKEISFDILEMPKKKTLGLFGGSPAKVRAYVEMPDEKGANPKTENNKTKQNKSKNVKKTKPESQNNPIDDKVPISDPQKIEFANKAVNYLGNILKLIGVESEISSSDYEGGIELTLEGSDLGVVVGKRGETLDALQYLTVLAANNDKTSYQRIILNTGDYRVKRKETLQALAKRISSQALKNNKNIALDCMNPYERRIVHMTVHSIEGVDSWSIGEEPHRRVVIGVDPKAPVSFKNTHRNNNSNSRNRSRTRNGQKSSGNVNREVKKDSASIPLYGKITTENK